MNANKIHLYDLLHNSNINRLHCIFTGFSLFTFIWLYPARYSLCSTCMVNNAATSIRTRWQQTKNIIPYFKSHIALDKFIFRGNVCMLVFCIVICALYRTGNSQFGCKTLIMCFFSVIHFWPNHSDPTQAVEWRGARCKTLILHLIFTQICMSLP